MSRVTCHMSCVTCNVSCVTCQVSNVIIFFFIVFGKSGEVYRWKVCNQRGLPRLVSHVIQHTLCKDAPGHQPGWTWRFGDSDFMRWYFTAQVLLMRSPSKFSTLGLAVLFVSLVNVKCVGSSLLQAEKQYTITRRSQQIFGCSERKDICHPQIERNMFREEAIPKKNMYFF